MNLFSNTSRPPFLSRHNYLGPVLIGSGWKQQHSRRLLGCTDGDVSERSCRAYSGRGYNAIFVGHIKLLFSDVEKQKLLMEKKLFSYKQAGISWILMLCVLVRLDNCSVFFVSSTASYSFWGFHSLVPLQNVYLRRSNFSLAEGDSATPRSQTDKAVNQSGWNDSNTLPCAQIWRRVGALHMEAQTSFTLRCKTKTYSDVSWVLRL